MKHRFQLMMHLAVVSVLVISIVGCTTLPKNFTPGPDSFGLAPFPEGRLAEFSARVRAEHGDEDSGLLILDTPKLALDWRLALIDHAKESIDTQYFIWLGDGSGTLALDRLIDAADRGVRVRLLIDDLRLLGGDKAVKALDMHPNFEVRVFNPWRTRKGLITAVGRGFEFLFHIKRLNHRMHNKLLQADNQLAIVGGRNMGNEYYGMYKKYNFRDLDLLAAGPVVTEVTDAFDYYWNSDWVYPGDLFAPKLGPEGMEKLRDEISEELDNAGPALATFPLERRDWTDELEAAFDQMYFGPSHVVFDDLPAGKDLPPVQVADSLDELAQEIEEEVIIVSAYFIPGQEFLDWLEKTTAKGIRVRILTNSLSSNDEPISNSGYKKYRKPVLERGGELHEMRANPDNQNLDEIPPTEAEFLGLHTKAIVIDRRISFVGSLNLDPRSIYLNTEMGLIVDDPELGEALAQLLERDFSPANSWRVFLNEDGKLRWESVEGIVKKQPARSGGQRFQDGFYSLLPIEKHL